MSRKSDDDDTPPAITFNFVNHQFVNIFPQDLVDWQEACPDVNVREEIGRIKLWCIANPGKIKTRQGLRKKGLRATITNWLRREQEQEDARNKLYNRGRRRVNEPAEADPEKVKKFFEEQQRRWDQERED